MKLIDKAQEDKTTLILISIVCFLLGIVIGIVIAPVKKGLSIGSNNTIIGGDDDEDDDWHDGYDEDEVVEF